MTSALFFLLFSLVSVPNVSHCSSKGGDGIRTWVGEVGLVALDHVGDVLLALVELLHIIGDDGLASCG